MCNSSGKNLGLESQVKGMAFNKLGTVASTESHFGSFKKLPVWDGGTERRVSGACCSSLCAFVPALCSAESFSVYPWGECSPPTSYCCIERGARSLKGRWARREGAVCVLFVGEVPLEAELMISAYIHLSLCPPLIISVMLPFVLFQRHCTLDCHSILIDSSIFCYWNNFIMSFTPCVG